MTSRNRLAVSGGDWEDSTFARAVTEGSAMSADLYVELCALPEHLTGEILKLRRKLSQDSIQTLPGIGIRVVLQ